MTKDLHELVEKLIDRLYNRHRQDYCSVCNSGEHMCGEMSEMEEWCHGFLKEAEENAFEVQEHLIFTTPMGSDTVHRGSVKAIPIRKPKENP